MSEYGRIDAPFWRDKPVAIVAGGPSLIGFDFERLRGHAHVIAVKGSIFDLPWADCGFGLDFIRFREWKQRLMDASMRVYWALPTDRLKEAGPSGGSLTYLKRLDGEGISEDRSEIYTGGTSGYGALQIAIHKQARDVYLFGYDYNGEAAPAGQFRHNDQHYQRAREQNAASWGEWATYFDRIVPELERREIRVFNACPRSTIKCFRKMTIDDAVRAIQSG
jgi:hypothetical protein